MNRYVLLQASAANEEDYAPQIIIIDNSTNIGKGRVVMKINEGYKPIGYIESDMQPQALKLGFMHDERVRADIYRDQKRRAIEILEGA